MSSKTQSIAAPTWRESKSVQDAQVRKLLLAHAELLATRFVSHAEVIEGQEFVVAGWIHDYLVRYSIVRRLAPNGK